MRRVHCTLMRELSGSVASAAFGMYGAATEKSALQNFWMAGEYDAAANGTASHL